MQRSTRVSVFALTLIGFGPLASPHGVEAFAQSAPAVTPQTVAASIKLDAVHSAALFRIQHLGAGFFWGRFNARPGHLKSELLSMNQTSPTAISPTLDQGKARACDAGKANSYQ